MNDNIEIIYGVKCETIRFRHPITKRYSTEYKFTVDGWPECCVIGKTAAKRVIGGRLEAAVRNTLGLD